MTEQTKGHISAVRQSILMIETIEIYLGYSNLDIYTLFSLLSERDSYSKLYFIEGIYYDLKNGFDFDYAYKNSLQKSNLTHYLDKDDIDLLSCFFSILGRSDVDGQISNCKLYKQFLTQKLNALECQEKSKRKSNFALSIGSGLIISILFFKV